MKNISLIVSLFLTGLIYSSCERAPEFPNEPTISFEAVEFLREVPDRNNSGNLVDKLNISVNFKDGDGDLGITSQYDAFPFHEVTFFSNKSPYEPIHGNFNISSKDLLKINDLDTLPRYNAFDQENGDCVNYNLFFRKEIANNDTVDVIDTVYMQLNRNFYNFFVDVYVKENGQFEFFDFYKETCIPIDGRFTFLNTADHERPLEGTLTYSFETFNLQDRYFNDDTLMLKVHIQDRALNKSNIIESPEFTLNSVRAN